jgi:hypothetical protein
MARNTLAEALSEAMSGTAGASATMTETTCIKESVEWSSKSIDFLPPISILPFYDLHLMA